MDAQKLQNAFEVAKELYEEIKQDTDSITKSKDGVIDDILMSNMDKFLSKETFVSMELGDILKALYEVGYSRPSVIQKVVIPAIKDKVDIVVQSKSGTGKTLAFVVGILTQIEKGKGPQAVILSPTRELNTQIYNEICKLTNFSGIKTHLALRDKQVERLDHEILLGSPAAILSLCTRRQFDYRKIKILVLDETDVLLDKSTMGSQTFRLLKALDNAQKVFISATYNDDIKKTISAYAPQVREFYEKKNAKPEEIKLFHIDIDYKYKVDALQAIYSLLTVGQVIVFVSKKSTVKKLEEILVDDCNSVSILHGELLPEERDLTVKNFKTSNTKILVTTDVFSRGMDIPQVNLIINFDLPYKHGELLVETYIHRIGRSGRFGRSGFVIDMISGVNELTDYIKIQEELGTISRGFTIEELENVNIKEIE